MLIMVWVLPMLLDKGLSVLGYPLLALTGFVENSGIWLICCLINVIVASFFQRYRNKNSYKKIFLSWGCVGLVLTVIRIVTVP